MISDRYIPDTDNHETASGTPPRHRSSRDGSHGGSKQHKKHKEHKSHKHGDKHRRREASAEDLEDGEIVDTDAAGSRDRHAADREAAKAAQGSPDHEVALTQGGFDTNGKPQPVDEPEDRPAKHRYDPRGHLARLCRGGKSNAVSIRPCLGQSSQDSPALLCAADHQTSSAHLRHMVVRRSTV